MLQTCQLFPYCNWVTYTLCWHCHFACQDLSKSLLDSKTEFMTNMLFIQPTSVKQPPLSAIHWWFCFVWCCAFVSERRSHVIQARSWGYPWTPDPPVYASECSWEYRHASQCPTTCCFLRSHPGTEVWTASRVSRWGFEEVIVINTGNI